MFMVEMASRVRRWACVGVLLLLAAPALAGPPEVHIDVVVAQVRCSPDGSSPLPRSFNRILETPAAADSFVDALKKQRGKSVEIVAKPGFLTVSGTPVTHVLFTEESLPPGVVARSSSRDHSKDDVIKGVRFLATVKNDGKIRLEVEPEVSLLHRESGKRMIESVKTTTELKPGETFALGGLCHPVTRKHVTALPVLSALPVVGELFRVWTEREEEVELVFLVTPTVVAASGER